MAISLGMCCGGNKNLITSEKFLLDKRCDMDSKPMSWMIREGSFGWRPGSKGRLSITGTKATKSSMNSVALLGIFDQKTRRGSVTTAVEAHETLDEWMRGSVLEIVKNLQETPLLVEVSAVDNKNTVKKAKERDWRIMEKRCEKGERLLPERLIFVEKLNADEPEGKGAGGGGGGDGSSTKAWGIVVQGKGEECGPACYLLKTTRVGAGGGLGLCTHFCLMPVVNFNESVQSQLRNCWLLQNQRLRECDTHNF